MSHLPYSITRELLTGEVEILKQESILKNSLKQGLDFSSLLHLAGQTNIPALEKSLKALAHASGKLLSDQQIQAKRLFLETELWLQLSHAIYYTHPTREKAEPLLNDLRDRLSHIHVEIDSYEDKILTFRTSQRPQNFETQVKHAVEKMDLFFKQELKKAPDLPQSFIDQVELFLKETFKQLNLIGAFAFQELPLWDQIVLKEGRGLLITHPTAFAASLIYTAKGDLYVVGNNLGNVIGMGSGKIISRIVHLQTGNVLALVKPKKISEDNPSIEGRRNTTPFWEMLQESDFLLKLQNQRGILDVKERFIFESEGSLWTEEVSFIRQKGMKTLRFNWPSPPPLQLYLIETLYPDGTLHQRLHNTVKEPGIEKGFSLKEKIAIAGDLLAGLCAIHNQGIIHHDLKPDNILLSLKEKGISAVISDFDLSCFDQDLKGKEKLAMVFYTAPPEYAKVMIDPKITREKVTAVTTYKIDIWSMGLTLYSLFNDIYFDDLWPNHLKGKEVLPLIINLTSGWVPFHAATKKFYPLFLKMLEPDPDKRGSAQEALELFEKITSEPNGN